MPVKKKAVAVNPPLGRLGGTIEAFLEVLVHKMTRYDMFLEKRGDMNIHRIAHWLGAKQKIEKAAKSLLKKDDEKSLAQFKKITTKYLFPDFPPVKGMFKQIDRWLKEGIYPSLTRKKVKREEKTEALFGPKIPDAYQGRKVYGELPDKGAARTMAKRQGCDTVRIGLIMQERAGFKAHWKVGWLGYKGEEPIGAVIEEHKSLSGPAKLDWVKGKGEPLGKAVKAEILSALIDAGRTDLANTIAAVDPQERIIEFLKENPEPDDDQFHELAEQIGMSPHDLEEIAYKMLQERI